MIYVLGDRPGSNTDPKRPLFPHTTVGAAANLARIMGLSPEAYVASTERMNVWHDGDQLLARHEAIPRLDGLWSYFDQERDPRPDSKFLVVIVGREALSLIPQPYRERLEVREYGVVVSFSSNVDLVYVPHTSGRNRVWNDPQLKKEITCRVSALVRSHLSRSS
jgi:hypothetical protein